MSGNSGLVDLVDRHQNEIFKLLDVVSIMASRGEAVATGGNYSLKLNDQFILISRSGVDKAKLKNSDLLIIDEKEKIFENADFSLKTNNDLLKQSVKTSAETPLHLEIFKQTDAKCVLHSHGPFSLIFAQMFLLDGNIYGVGEIKDLEMMKAFKGILTHENKVMVPIFENSQDMNFLSNQFIQTYKDFNNSADQMAPGFILKGHGLYVWGESVEEAKRHLDAFNYLFEYYYRLWTVKNK